MAFIWGSLSHQSLFCFRSRPSIPIQPNDERRLVRELCRRNERALRLLALVARCMCSKYFRTDSAALDGGYAHLVVRWAVVENVFPPRPTFSIFVNITVLSSP